MIKLTLMRHGRSEADDLKLHEGRFDSPLTEIGIAQAKARSQQWKNEKRSYDLIVSSPLKRARTCAEIIASQLQVELILSESLMERDNGSLAGLSFSESARLYPKSDFLNPYQPYVVCANNGESHIELYCRAALALQSIIRRGTGTYLMVSHGGFLNALLNVVCGNQPRANTPGLIFALGDLSYVDTRYDPLTDTWIIDQMCPGLPSIIKQIETTP